MHIKGKIYSVQKEELKLLSTFPAVYNQYMEILTLLRKHVSIFPLTYYVYSFEGKCKCKSSAAQIAILRNNKENFIIFRTDFILVIPKKFVKKKYLPNKPSGKLSPLLHNIDNIDMC